MFHQHHLTACILTTTAVLALIGCAQAPVVPDHAPPGLRTSLVPTAEWERVTRPGFGAPPGFSFLLPPGFERFDLQPIDSDAATYVRGEAELHYDFGPYSGRPTATGGDVIEQQIRIGGRGARVVAYTRADGRQVVAAWWENVSRGPIGRNHLLIRAEFPSPADRDELLASIYSVEWE
ncbi:MAG: hypothetical protein WD737_11675 [Gemmatimonadota bacterium]